MAADGVGRGRLRASHADRDRVIDLLKVAFMQGRLTKDEFGLRLDQTFASRTYAELSALTADLPIDLLRAGPPAGSVPAQAPLSVNKALMRGACAVLVVAVGSVLAAFPANSFLLLLFGVLAILVSAPVAVTLMFDSRRERRSRGRPAAA